MNKSLLIHSDNTPLSIQKLFSNDNVINFNHIQENYSTLDDYISNTILSEIKTKNPNIIFIKDNLSSNYLELYGLRLAYHIRFEENLKLLPIVILSDIDGFTLNRLEPSAKILFTQNIFIIENSKKAFDTLKKREMKPFNEENYKSKFLDLISVEAPENSSNHSIANEWAIYRWSEFLKVKSEATIKNGEKIASMLYFKYLLAKNHINLNDENDENNNKLKNSGNVLFIDDEWDKGWGDIFEKYFSKNNDINFTINNEKNKSIKLKEMDIIILDLRIIEKDHNKDTEIKDLTGVRYIQKIKEINAGIQIIMFTATGNSLILEELQTHGILGYIKKGHPEDRSIEIVESFDKLAMLLDRGLDKKYLKEIWKIEKNILGLTLLHKSDDNSIKIKAEIETVFEILDSDLENKIKFTILTIFKVLEILCDIYYEENKDDGAYKKITSLLDTFSIDIDKDKISQFVCTRNFLVHSGEIKYICKNKVVQKPTKNHILDWFKMLQTILFEIDKK